jgi:2-polyprenyl-3-methyl-5-hydroxy-6-metoxy-1,4-benzoquinol methylase
MKQNKPKDRRMKDHTESVSHHYDAGAKNYHLQYDRELLHDTSRDYPANYFRLQLLLNSFIAKGLKRVIEVGVGEGTPLSTLARTGMDVWGFDISEAMVQKSKERMQENKLNPEHIFWGDIQDPITYSHALRDGLFDGLMAMGVMPHVENDDMVIDNMATLVRPGGSVFIEFRNKLFSLFTLNRHTSDFILNDLLKGVSPELKEVVAKDLNARLRMDMPPQCISVKGTDAPGYDAILSKFHNPFEVMELFEKHNFGEIKLHWYHYHPAMPFLGSTDPSLFRQEAIRLEHEPSNWRGYFLCSAFVVEAVKIGANNV